MKKLILTTAAFALLSAGVMAQNQAPAKRQAKPLGIAPIAKTINSIANSTNPPAYIGTMYDRCGAVKPTQAWDDWFNQKVEAFKQTSSYNRTTGTTATSYTIPIIFHVITYTASGTVPTGTFPQLTAAQINSQIAVLNADYAGTGVGVGTYTALTSGGHGPFYDYANGNSLPTPDNTTSGVAVANTGIHFCAAMKNPSGVALAEPGIDRVNCYSFTHSGYTSSNPAQSSLTQNTFSSFMDAVIKPPTIWDPTKYFNVWLTDEYQGTSTVAGVGLLGYSTFPTGTTLGGLSGGGSGTASSTTDGCWVYAAACGNTGHVSAPYNLGRTLTHESGHYFGLRHTWGDGTCATDYCNDTPPEASATYYGSGTYTSTATSSGITTWKYPFNSYYQYASSTATSLTSFTAACSGSGAYNSDLGDGVMYMAFMDYSDDKFMCMFTNDEMTRMVTALTQCPDRSGLTTSAVSVCNLTQTAPTAAFTYPSSLCLGVAEQFADASTGPPSTWAWSVNPSTGVTVTSASSQNPSITFPSAGTYTVTLVATNTVSSSSVSHTVAVTSCALLACDTLSNFASVDSMTIFNSATSAGVYNGYVSGTNGGGQSAVAEYYNSSTLANTQIKSAIVLFFKYGTMGVHGTGTVSLDILNGDNTNGPTGTAVATATANLATIVSTAAKTSVDYCGDPGLAFSVAVIVPYKFTFATPVTTPTSGFFASMNIPTASADTIAIWQNTQGTPNTVNTAWDKASSGTWSDAQSDWGFDAPVSYAILPIVCPVTSTGIEHNELGNGITLFPNPNSGQFNFAVTLNEATNLNFTIVNTLGQVVYSKVENNVTNAFLSCDLSGLAKGIYYANITDSNNNKTVKKIIIQ